MTTNNTSVSAVSVLAIAMLVTVLGIALPSAAHADGGMSGDWYGAPTGGDWYGTAPSSGGDWYGGSTGSTGGDWYGGSSSGDWTGGSTGGDWYGSPSSNTDSYGPSSYNNYGPSSYTLTPPQNYNNPTYYGNSSYGYNQPYQTDFSYVPVSYYSSMPYGNNYQTDYSYYPGTYDYSYDSYDYEYTYEYIDDTYDACSNIRGDQPHGYDCYPDRDRDEDVSCDLSVSDSTVEDGDRVTLEWETDGNPSSASINEGIGRVDEDGGSERVRIDGDTTFRMTVRNSSGDEDTCSVTVRVDDENNFSSVSFVGDPTNNPPVVYLSDIPYTGLEDISPALLSYWLMLIAAAAGGVWFLYTKGMIPTFAFASAEPLEEGVVGDIAEGSGHATPEVENFLAALQNNDTDKALDYVRDAAHNGTGVEEFLASAESVASDSELQARVSAALAESRMTGIRGVKSVLA